MTRSGFRGDSARGDVVLNLSPAGPWSGRVRIVALALRTGTRFEVTASWFGPPAPGFPPDDRPGDRSDTFVEPDLEHARAIATRAFADLRAGQAPDLPAISRALRGASHAPLVRPNPTGGWYSPN